MKSGRKINIIVCPRCKGELNRRDNYSVCKYCKAKYPIINGIPLMVSNFENETIRQKSIYDSLYLDAIENLNRPTDFYESRNLTIGKYIYFLDKYIGNCKKGNIEILEIGVGGGQMLGTVNKKYGFYPYGIDISIESVRLARRSSSVSPDKITVCDGCCLCFPDSVFDIVYTFGVFEHLYNVKKCIAEINRVLKAGGIMISSSAVKDFKYTLHGIDSILQPHNQAKSNLAVGHDYKNILTKSELRDFVKDSSFSILETLCWDILFQPLYDYKILMLGKKLRKILRHKKYKVNENIITEIVPSRSTLTTILKKIFYHIAKCFEMLDYFMRKFRRGASLFIVAWK